MRCRVPGFSGADAGACIVRNDRSVYDPITSFEATSFGFDTNPAVVVTVNGATCYDVSYGGSTFRGLASNEATLRDGEGNVVAIHRIVNDVFYCGGSLDQGIPYAVVRGGECNRAQQAALNNPYYTTTGCTRTVGLSDGGPDSDPTPAADGATGTDGASDASDGLSSSDGGL